MYSDVHSVPTTKPQKAPIYNPYDKFTKPEFDEWIGGITSALRHALGYEHEIARAPQRSPEDMHSDDEDTESASRGVSVELESDGSASHLGAKGKARDPRDGPGLGAKDAPIEIDSDSDNEGNTEEEYEDDDEEDPDGFDSDHSDGGPFEGEDGEQAAPGLFASRGGPTGARAHDSFSPEDEVESGAEFEEEEEEEEYDDEDERGNIDDQGSAVHALKQNSPEEVIDLASDDEDEVEGYERGSSPPWNQAIIQAEEEDLFSDEGSEESLVQDIHSGDSHTLPLARSVDADKGEEVDERTADGFDGGGECTSIVGPPFAMLLWT